MSRLETISQHCKTLRLPTIAVAVPEAVALAEQQAWSLGSFLLYLLEHEAAGRQQQQRRIERLLRESQSAARTL